MSILNQNAKKGHMTEVTWPCPFLMLNNKQISRKFSEIFHVIYTPETISCLLVAKCAFGVVGVNCAVGLGK